MWARRVPSAMRREKKKIVERMEKTEAMGKKEWL